MFLGTYSSYLDPAPEIYLLGTQVRYRPPNYDLLQGTVYSIHPHYANSVVPEEDPIYLIYIQKTNIFLLTLKHMDFLGTPHPTPTQKNNHQQTTPKSLPGFNIFTHGVHTLM